MAEYPEHEKLHKVKDKSQAIGEFLDWLRQENGLILAEYLHDDEELVPSTESSESLLAEFFEIDLKKIEIEKRAMLDVQRALNKR